MKLQLTPDQVEQLRPHMKPEMTMLCRIGREQFDGSNPGTCGTIHLEFGTVLTNALPALREAIRNANEPKARKPRKAKV